MFLLLYQRVGSLQGSVCFWRSKSGAEVDFIIDRAASPIPCEVKFTVGAPPSIGRSLRSFIERYAPKRAFLVSKEARVTTRVGETAVEIIPFPELLDDEFGLA